MLSDMAGNLATKAEASAALAAEILDELSGLVLRVGELLDAVYVEPAQLESFVVDYLPLHPQTAERIRCMYLVHRDKAGNDALPEPYKALWTFG